MILNEIFKIHPTTTFKNELEDIIYYIKNKLKEPLLADHFYKNVVNEISSLDYMPERYMKISSYKKKFRNLRRLPIDKYVVIYEVNNNTRSSFYFTHLSW